MRLGKFYIEAPNQLKDNESIYLCYETREEAEGDVDGFYPHLRPEIRLMQTIDSDIPFRDTADCPTPNHEATRFPSQRYCIVLVDTRIEEQGV